jgi:hypothetical protein
MYSSFDEKMSFISINIRINYEINFSYIPIITKFIFGGLVSIVIHTYEDKREYFIE